MKATVNHHKSVKNLDDKQYPLFPGIPLPKIVHKLSRDIPAKALKQELEEWKQACRRKRDAKNR